MTGGEEEQAVAGLRGEKTAAEDPAVAPLPTDAEASGRMPTAIEPMRVGAERRPPTTTTWLLGGAVAALVLIGVISGMISAAGL
ncbi:MAG: hypothetical protein H3C38_04055 [Rhodospirillales bacterium]|nr:hypothetical protein [Rhodospirillales bacterium]